MKRNVGIVVDSTFGIDQAFARKHDITVVPLKVIIDGKEYVDGTFDPSLVVHALQNKLEVKTSQPSPEQFMKAFEDQLKRYESVICITLSKTLSGTYNSANLGKTILENPHVHVVDSESTINGGSYMTERLITFLDEGHDLKQGLHHLEQLKSKGSIIFTIDNLQSLIKSGRIGKIQAVIGNILKIKPILRFKQGVLELEHKVRNFSNVMLYLIEETKKLISQGKVIVRIAYVDQSIQAKELEHEIYQIDDQIDIRITGVISPVVSAHVGLGGLGIYLAYE
jgi:DegV family protein with EDD domain